MARRVTLSFTVHDDAPIAWYLKPMSELLYEATKDPLERDLPSWFMVSTSKVCAFHVDVKVEETNAKPPVMLDLGAL
jgi:hypothetical protein